MKPYVLLSLVALANLGGEAVAACSGTQITDTATKETAVVTFPSLKNNDSVTVAGLTFTARGAQTSTVAAGAYSGLSNSATTGPQTANGNYTGTLSGWSSGTASGANVTFTSASTGNVTNIVLAGSPTAPTAVTTDGGSVTLSSLLTGNTVCVGSAGNWEAQEYHQSGGNLIDYKRGPSDPVDATASVGTWSISGSGTSTKVTYFYGSSTYSNTVWDHANGTYSFCNPAETVATIKTGQGACP